MDKTIVSYALLYFFPRDNSLYTQFHYHHHITKNGNLLMNTRKLLIIETL
jgi:hypothetical protein